LSWKRIPVAVSAAAMLVGVGPVSVHAQELSAAGTRRPSAETAERTGDAAEQAGRFQTAFSAYLNAFQSLAEPPAPGDDQRLREKIIKVVQKLEIKPVVPQTAREHLEKAESLVAAETILGGSGDTASQEAAAGELRQAVRIAPWSPDASLRLATVLQRLRRFDEALLNLNLYKLADPAGYAATIARATPGTAARPLDAPAPPAASSLGPALIYVYWPKQNRGNDPQKVRCNDRHVADLQHTRFVVLKAAAGTHILTFRDRDVTALVEAGREYHYRASLEGHWEISQKAVIRLMSADVAKAEMREQDIRASDPKRTFTTECIPIAATGRQSR
jgi:tetratricopeptide (TPR) repeat protein